MTDGYPPPAIRHLVTIFALMGAFMTQLDATIANVALPHMQASTSASREQISWVLTSYIIMAAICTPLSGWLSQRYGRKQVMVGSLLGFTVASMLCGMAANLDQLIAFRLLQGMMGAALLPMSQAILLDINPPEKHGSAMAIWGMGAIIGPIVGPVLGGYLTDNLTWRWVFYVNLPFGLLAALGLWIWLTDTHDTEEMKLDFLGFGSLALAVGAFQLMLDRGQVQDWFQSTEICIEAAVAATAFYVFLVHTFTAKKPFIKPELFRDSNYLLGNVFGFFLGGLMYGTMALMAPMLAELMNYPIELVGFVTAPRGFGTLISMIIGGRIINRVDPRLMIFIGLGLCGWSQQIISGSSLAMDDWIVVASGFVQGLGAGLMFVPITIIVFATLNSRYRNEGAALNSLVRNLGGAVWISVLQTLTIRNAEVVHSRLSEGVRPDNPMLGFDMPDFDFDAARAVAQMHAEITRQSLMVSYIDAFWLLLVICVAIMPCVVFLKKSKQSSSDLPPAFD
jgi:DHA2 family multidrug resistance protein